MTRVTHVSYHHDQSRDEGCFLQFSLRSRAIGPVTLSARGRRQLVCLVPANGCRGRALQLLTLSLLSVGVVRALRRTTAWPLPISRQEWNDIKKEILNDSPEQAEFIWHLPPPDQPQAKFAAMGLDRDGTPRSFIRVTLSAVAALCPAQERGSRSGVAFPTRINSWGHGAWTVERTTVVLTDRHRPVQLEMNQLLALIDDVQDVLRTPNPPEAHPSHWRPAHGDLTFWNIRRDTTGTTALIDWEQARWAPPHTDLVRYLFTAPHASHMIESVPQAIGAELGEAMDYWDGVLAPAEGEPAWASRVIERQRRCLEALKAHQ